MMSTWVLFNDILVFYCEHLALKLIELVNKILLEMILCGEFHAILQ